jgi:hypothetical protein
LNLIRTYTPDEFGDYTNYYGGKGYGFVPTDILTGLVKMCRNCGNIGIYDTSGTNRCVVCDRKGEMITIKKATPREIIDYTELEGKYGKTDSYEAQQYLKKRYAQYIKNIPMNKHQKAKVKKRGSVLDRAVGITGVRRIKF